MVYPKRTDQVIGKEVKGKGLLLNVRDGSYFEMNTVGWAIWNGCNGQASMEAIARKIGRRFGVPFSQADRDVKHFLGELKRLKMVAMR